MRHGVKSASTGTAPASGHTRTLLRVSREQAARLGAVEGVEWLAPLHPRRAHFCAISIFFGSVIASFGA
jgi:hypothetical protein